MIKLNKFILAGIALFLASGISAAAESTREFSYPDADAKVLYFGDGKAQTYDIAIRIVNPALVGTKVTSLSVELCEDATVTEPKAWLSSDLLIDSKKLNAPDIAVVDAQVSEGNVLTAQFAEPYVIPAEGVYVGYSITIANATTFGDENPNPVAASTSPDGAYIHSTRTNKKWTSLAEYGVASCMEVSLSGEFSDYAVAINDITKVRTDGSTNSIVVPFTICNLGSTEINSLEVSCIFGDEAPLTTDVAFDEPVSAKFCSTRKVEVALPAAFVTTTLKMAVVKVNGEPNAFASDYAEGEYVVMTFIPVTRPLMEEYTGLWCKWCPRGWVAMEEMNEAYPSDFVCISYHDGDMIQFLSSYPNPPAGYPSAYMNRSIITDPYYGNAEDGFGIRDLWLSLREAECNADIEASVEWADDSKKSVVCKSKVRFVNDVNGDDYRVHYVLVGDGFKTVLVYNEDGSLDREASVILKQNNGYAGSAPLDDSEFWEPIVNGGATITDLEFNDVAMAMSPAGGEKAFPAAVEHDEYYEHQTTFDYASIKGVESGVNVLPAGGNLRCVAVLLTADGKFVNCNKSAPVAVSGVNNVLNDSIRVVATEWYDLQGRRLGNAPKGVSVRVDKMSDGTVRTVKTVR